MDDPQPPTILAFTKQLRRFPWHRVVLLNGHACAIRLEEIPGGVVLREAPQEEP